MRSSVLSAAPCRGLGSAAETASRGPWVPSGHAQKVHAVPAPLVGAVGLGSGVSGPDRASWRIHRFLQDA